jgi:hypothetical protein
MNKYVVKLMAIALTAQKTDGTVKDLSLIFQ